MAADRLSAGPRRLLGLFMIGLVVLLLVLCVAFYNKAFTKTVPVTMRIDQVDNSFLPQSEVRMRGVTVGEVTDVTTDGREAILAIDLQPDAVSRIPANVTAALLPKSLFGERYVALESPANPSPERIKAGDVITRDRSRLTVQTEQVFNHLLPLLEAVRPADLANTLGALNQALSGRGDQLGDTVTLLHRYLARFNPALPDLTADIRAIPPLTDTYSEAAPDLIEGLETLTTTTKTLEEKQDDFLTFYHELTDTSDDLREFLEDNRSNIVNLVETARPVLELLARYSPEYVCLFTRLADAIPLGKPVFGEGTARPALNITLEVVATRGKYLPHQDEPEFTDNRGPACYDNTAPIEQYPGGPYQDGSTHPAASPQAVQLNKLFTGGLSSNAARPTEPSVPLLGGSGSGGNAGRDADSKPSGPLGSILGDGQGVGGR